VSEIQAEIRAFLFAHPAKHSLSPVMHNAALAQLGIAARYEARDVKPEDLRAALEELRGSSVWGVNLSIPHKQMALEMVDGMSAEARAIGAINTVVHRDGKLQGLNTDAPGFMRSLEDAGVNVRGCDVVVLGAGGAARGACWALKQAGANVAVWNRTPARARELAEEFKLEAFLTDDLLSNAIEGSSGLVNTTSVGLENSDESPIADHLLPAGGETNSQWVCDIVYRPLETKLLLGAREHGIKTVDGLGMLVHQGALALEAWTGRHVSAEVMRQAALEELGEASLAPTGQRFS
jgi:shikimate dehydrogenase